MPRNEDTSWPEIECQLDEILLQVSSGIPEECVMRSIGVPFSEWASFKVRRMNASVPLIQYLRCDAHGNPYESKRRLGANVHRPYAGEILRVT